MSQSADLHAIDALFKKPTSNFVLDCEQCIMRLLQAGRPDEILDLLHFLDDGSQWNELMYSLIHSAESVGPDLYARGIIKRLSRLSAQAPEWTDVLIARIVNSDKYRASLQKQYILLEDEHRKKIRSFAADLSSRHPKLAPKIEKLSLDGD